MVADAGVNCGPPRIVGEVFLGDQGGCVREREARETAGYEHISIVW